jgi:hypothetical protein
MSPRSIQGARRERRWRAAMERFAGSGLSVTQFCRREKLKVPSFYYWRARLSAERKPSSSKAAPSPFVDLGVMRAAPLRADAQALDIRLELGGAVVLHIRRG